MKTTKRTAPTHGLTAGPEFRPAVGDVLRVRGERNGEDGTFRVTSVSEDSFGYDVAPGLGDTSPGVAHDRKPVVGQPLQRGTGRGRRGR